MSNVVTRFLTAAGQGDEAARCALVSEEFLTVESETPAPCPNPEFTPEPSPEARILKPASVSQAGPEVALVTADIGAADGGAIFIVDASKVVGVLSHESGAAGQDPGVYTTSALPAGDVKTLVADSRPQVELVGRMLAGLATGAPAAVCENATTDAVVQLIDVYGFIDDEDYPSARPDCRRIVDSALGAASPDAGDFADAGKARLRAYAEPDGIARVDLVRTSAASEEPERDWFGSVMWLKRTSAGWRVMALSRTSSTAENAYNPGS